VPNALRPSLKELRIVVRWEPGTAYRRPVAGAISIPLSRIMFASGWRQESSALPHEEPHER
jgi:hypothetical protein